MEQPEPPSSLSKRESALLWLAVIAALLLFLFAAHYLQSHRRLATYLVSTLLAAGIGAFYVWLARLVRFDWHQRPADLRGRDLLERLRNERWWVAHDHLLWLNTGGSAPILLLAITGPVLDFLLLFVSGFSTPSQWWDWFREEGLPLAIPGVSFVGGCTMVIVARVRTARQFAARLEHLDAEIQAELDRPG